MKNAKRIVLALGSNVGNRRENLVRALAEIENFARILSRSKIYETAPVGFADQRDFLNAAVLCETQFEPAGSSRILQVGGGAAGADKDVSQRPARNRHRHNFLRGTRVFRRRAPNSAPAMERARLRACAACRHLGLFRDRLLLRRRGVLGSAPKKYQPFAEF